MTLRAPWAVLVFLASAWIWAACGGSDGTDAGNASPDGGGSSASPDAATEVPDGATSGGSDAAASDGGPGDAGSDASSDGGSTNDAATLASDPRCAGDAGTYVLVPGNATLGTTDFCVAAFEAKDGGGVPLSVPATAPVVNVQRAEAAASCKALGTEYDLPTNAQWQTLARAIESVPANWSGATVGSGDLPRGHSDAVPLGVVSVTDLGDPCDQTQNPGCTVAGASFSQRRTHVLPSGRVVWDVAGNAAEWVADDIAAPGFFVSFARNATGDTQKLLGPATSLGAGTYPEVSSNYPSYARVQAGSMASVGGQNFQSPSSIWVRSGGLLFVRGTNYFGNIYLEPGAMFLNLGSNVLDPATRVKSATSSVLGYFGASSTTAENDYTNCGGTCPANTVTYTTDESRGEGVIVVYGSPGTLTRGGSVGLGPVAGVFSAIQFHSTTKWTGFRCVKPAAP